MIQLGLGVLSCLITNPYHATPHHSTTKTGIRAPFLTPAQVRHSTTVTRGTTLSSMTTRVASPTPRRPAAYTSSHALYTPGRQHVAFFVSSNELTLYTRHLCHNSLSALAGCYFLCEFQRSRRRTKVSRANENFTIWSRREQSVEVFGLRLTQ